MRRTIRRVGYPRACFSFHVEADQIICIVDEDSGARSVTNDILAVLYDVAQALALGSLRGYRVIYRDSMGQWDEVRLDTDGRFVSFQSLGGATELSEALLRLRWPAVPQ